MTGFDEFYKVYPRKKGKAIARAKYTLITTTGLHTRAKDTDGNMNDLFLQATPDEILNAARVYAYRMMVEETHERFIKCADAWLNAGRWMDEEDHIEEFLDKIERLEAAKLKLRLVT